jgi:NADH:ubiquinone reductase (H+-translocating)
MGSAPHVVVLGAGFAGLEVARRLHRTRAQLTVVDRHNYHLFQPLLHELAAAVLQPADIAEAVRRELAPREGLSVLMDEVKGIDRASRSVHFAHRTLSYDYLVVGLGADSSYFGHDEWRARTFSLKSLHDASRLRHRLLLALENAAASSDPALRRWLLSFVVVGAGASGVQLAAALADFSRTAVAAEYRSIASEDVAITLVEALPRILAGMDERLAEDAARRLRQKGVRLLLDTPVEDVLEGGVVAGGEHIEAATVIWAAGVEAAPIAGWLGVEPGPGRRVEVGADLSLPGDPAVFVIGDNALVTGEDGKPLPGLAAVAKQQGRHVARVIMSRIEGTALPPAFRYRDRGAMVSLGRFAAIADLPRLKLRGFLAWLLWAVVHLGTLVNARQRLFVVWNWMWAHLAMKPGARIIVSQEGMSEPLASGEEPASRRRSA